MIEMNKNYGALILPAYNETESIYELLLELDSKIPQDWHIIVVDDSPSNDTEEFVRIARSIIVRDQLKLHLIRNPKKSGRGAAVQIGFSYAIENLKPSFLIEMDSDGSHTVESLLLLIGVSEDEDFVIGSRYLKGSKIVGWPILRRAFSRLINFILRNTFRLNVFDWTNGLRRYSVKASLIQNRHQFLNSGFICLSEQILLLENHDIFPHEIPITFVDRTHGISTVTHMEILKSLQGIVRLFLIWK